MSKIAVFCDTYRNYEGWRKFISREHWDKFQPVVSVDDIRGVEFSDYIVTQTAHMNRHFGDLLHGVRTRLKPLVKAEVAQRANKRTKEESARAEKYKNMLIELKNIIDCSEGVTGYHCNGEPASWEEVLGSKFIEKLEKLK